MNPDGHWLILLLFFFLFWGNMPPQRKYALTPTSQSAGYAAIPPLHLHFMCGKIFLHHLPAILRLFLLYAPLCTTKQQNTQRLLLKVSNAYKPFLVQSHSGKHISPTCSGWLSKSTLICTDIWAANTNFVFSQVNVSFSNLAVSCLSIQTRAS